MKGIVAFTILINCLNVLSIRLTILHTNDVHARFEQVTGWGGKCSTTDEQNGGCYGGAARLQTKVEELRATEPNVVLLNAGDYYQGTLYFNQHTHNITATFMNKVNYDAMALGNHEFDNGVEGLVPFLDSIQFPVLACNLNLSGEPRLQGKVLCSVGLKLKNRPESERLVAVVGYLTPETTMLNDAGGVVFYDEVSSLRSAVRQLRESGYKIIIALGHSGFQTDIRIAENVDVDIVIGGHSNTFLYNGNSTIGGTPLGPYPYVVTRADHSKCLVVQAYANGLYLGYLKADFDNDGRLTTWQGNPILLDNTVPQDNSTLWLLQPYKLQVEAYGSRAIGSTDVYLQEDYNCRLRECNMGNFLTDAVIYYYRVAKRSYRSNPVRLALWNSGIIRASIDEQRNNGIITVGDIITVAPYGNTIDLVKLKGVDLKGVMEHSVRTYDPSAELVSGAFMQVSGIRVVYNMTNAPGSRVTSLEALCDQCRVPRYFPVESNQTYLVAVPSYTVNGGDGFYMIKPNAVQIINSGDLDFDILLSYLERNSPVFAALEDRIRITY